MPEEYEIRLKGHLDDLWLPYFAGLKLIRLDNGGTLLSGSLQDKSALHGILELIRDLNLTLISVTCLSLSDSFYKTDEEYPSSVQ